MSDVLTFILAGGKGERLNPLTQDRAKPAVPFGGYRIIDFALSNCINSGLRRIYVLTQYKSFSLQKHLMGGWNILPNELGEFIDIIPAQQRVSTDWYKGTADAIYQNLYSVQDLMPELVLILAGDHIYKMDYRKLINYHVKKEADVTVPCISLDKSEAVNYGVIEVDDEYRIDGFQEKPKKPKTIPDDDSQIYASMGIYLFNRDVLFNELVEDAKKVSNHDFGKNVIPQMIKKERNVLAFQFGYKNKLSAYWRDIGTRDSYYQAHMDLVGSDPKFNLYDKRWPIRTYHEQFPPVNVMNSGQSEGRVIDSQLAGGCVISGATVKNSVLSTDVYVKKNAMVENSVLMEGSVIGENAKVRNAIVDKEVIIPDNAEIGFDAQADAKRFAITTSGIVMVPKKSDV